ncbi:Lysophospholipid acyltransferase [Spironucleus salmonicida]|uniref:Acyltransferase n=1 Tax=Spironucleus salmonicida TaxID=348837 RepID=V6LYB3_9EUKA|nr:Lysophospholipid acyltransferase [Spironucleus salmonicida]|eukprot:EST49223.1 Acyltransferase [Spironucleus salmonicida]
MEDSQIKKNFGLSHDKLNPFLQYKHRFHILDMFKGILFIPIALTVIPRVLLAVIISLILYLIIKPLSYYKNTYQFCKFLIHVNLMIISALLLIFCNPFPRKVDSNYLAASHRCFLDALFLQLAYSPSFLAKNNLQEIKFLSPFIRICQPIFINRDTPENIQWPTETRILSFPQGTFSNSFTVSRFKTGIFRHSHVVIISMQYFTLLDISGAGRSKFQELIRNFCNCGFVKIKQSVVQEIQHDESVQNFSDRMGIFLAEIENSRYVPYQLNDFMYFFYNKEIEKCSNYWLKDFGWMGTQKQYNVLCKKNNLQRNQQHDKNRFSILDQQILSNLSKLQFDDDITNNQIVLQRPDYLQDNQNSINK